MNSCGKRIIIFGINNSLREKVEHWVDDDVTIVGYADYGNAFRRCRQFAYKPFFSMRELVEKDDEYDYIIVCETDYKKWLEKRRNLVRVGCNVDKIIPTLIFKYPSERLFTSPLDDFIKMKRNFYGWCFGMSYSKTAFLEHFFTNDWFKFSTSGSDLHTYDSWLTYLFVNCPEQTKAVKQIIVELPYYTFDWDIQSSSQTYFRMVQFDRLSEYGTFLAKKKDAGEYIRKYRIMKELTQSRVEQAGEGYDNWVYNNANLEVLMKGQAEDYFEADNIWKKSHEDAMKMNIDRMVHIRDLCKMFKKELIICVFPMSPIFIEKNTDVYESKKERFYKIMKEIECDDKIIDMGNQNICFLNSDFRNLTHLNASGGMKISMELNKILKERKMAQRRAKKASE